MGECNHEMPGLPYPAFRRVNAGPGGGPAWRDPTYWGWPCGHRGPGEWETGSVMRGDRDRLPPRPLPERVFHPASITGSSRAARKPGGGHRSNRYRGPKASGLQPSAVILSPYFGRRTPAFLLTRAYANYRGPSPRGSASGLRMTAFEASSAQRLKLALMGLVPALLVEYRVPTAPWAPIFRTLRGLQFFHSRLEIVLDIGYRIS